MWVLRVRLKSSSFAAPAPWGAPPQRRQIFLRCRARPAANEIDIPQLNSPKTSPFSLTILTYIKLVHQTFFKEIANQRVRLLRPGQKLGMILTAHKPRMFARRQFQSLHKTAFRRTGANNHSGLLQSQSRVLSQHITMTVPLGYFQIAINLDCTGSM